MRIVCRKAAIGSAGSLETGMIIRDDELDAFQPAPDEAVEKGAPMDLRLGQSDRDSTSVYAIDSAADCLRKPCPSPGRSYAGGGLMTCVAGSLCLAGWSIALRKRF